MNFQGAVCSNPVLEQLQLPETKTYQNRKYSASTVSSEAQTKFKIAFRTVSRRCDSVITIALFEYKTNGLGGKNSKLFGVSIGVLLEF